MDIFGMRLDGHSLESSISGHDIALPLPTRVGHEKDYFHMLLLSSKDTQNMNHVILRVERMKNLTGKRDVGLIFLLDGASSAHKAMISFMQLQAE
jgi:hypothetical protein